MMLHRGWLQILVRATLIFVAVAVLSVVIRLWEQESLEPVDSVVAVAAAISSNIASLSGPTSIDSPSFLRLSSPRTWIVPRCGVHPRVPHGGFLTSSGVAVSSTGACRTQGWCADPIAVLADGSLVCKNGQGDVGQLVPTLNFEASQYTQTGRCATISATCYQRARFEMPTVMTELWPMEDGSASTAVFCVDGRFNIPTQHRWESYFIGLTSNNYAVEQGCHITRIILSDNAYYRQELAPTDWVLNALYDLQRIAASRIDDNYVVISIDGELPDANFCIKWFYQPLATRGARLIAFDGFLIQTHPPIQTTTCIQLADQPSGSSHVMLLKTDAHLSAFGTVVGIAVFNGVSYITDDVPSETLPLEYRRKTPHLLAVVVGFQSRSFEVFDTQGQVRALVPPDSPEFPPILLDGWWPQCVDTDDCRIVFAGDTALPPSLCYRIPHSVHLVSPVQQTTAAALLVPLVGSTIKKSSFPMVSLAGPDDSLFILPQNASTNSTISVQCGANIFRIPTEIPPTHCMPTAGIDLVGLVSVIWHNSSAEPTTNTSFDNCNLQLITTEYGMQLSLQPCIPMNPGTTLTYDNVDICVASSSLQRQELLGTLSAASLEITRSLGLLQRQSRPFLYAVS